MKQTRTGKAVGVELRERGKKKMSRSPGTQASSITVMVLSYSPWPLHALQIKLFLVITGSSVVDLYAGSSLSIIQRSSELLSLFSDALGIFVIIFKISIVRT